MAESPQERAARWIDARWKQRGDTPCPMCGHNEWGIGFPVLFSATAESELPANLPPGWGASFVYITVTCQTCGDTHFLPFNSKGEFPGILAEPSEPE